MNDLDYLMTLDWNEAFEPVEDGLWRVTVPAVRDFELVGTEQQVRAEWRDALRGLLAVYLNRNLMPPLPGPLFRHTANPSRTSGKFEFDWIEKADDLQVA